MEARMSPLEWLCFAVGGLVLVLGYQLYTPPSDEDGPLP
jgi:hypothetical protein